MKLNLYKKAGEHPTTIEDKDVEWVFMTSALNFSFWKDDHEPQYLVTYKVRILKMHCDLCILINFCLFYFQVYLFLLHINCQNFHLSNTDPNLYLADLKLNINQYIM